MSEAEYQRFAEKFVDGILDPNQPWLPQYLLTGGFAEVPTEEEINSGQLAFNVLASLDRDWLAESWKAEALFIRDRPKLVSWVMRAVSESYWF